MRSRKPTQRDVSKPRPSGEVVRDRHAPTTSRTRHAAGDAAQRYAPGADTQDSQGTDWLNDLERKQP
ncbi:MAG: hypothetical protein ABI702_13700 [Burkholderiales bacterium]